MKRLLIVVTCCLAVTAFAASKKKEQSATERLKVINNGFPYEVRVDRQSIPGKVIHWYSDGHSRTVTPHVVNCMLLTNTVDAAVIRHKKHKNDHAKAAKKDQKNLEKAIKELQKLQEKSSDEMKDLYQDAIDLFEGK